MAPNLRRAGKNDDVIDGDNNIHNKKNIVSWIIEMLLLLLYSEVWGEPITDYVCRTIVKLFSYMSLPCLSVMI